MTAWRRVRAIPARGRECVFGALAAVPVQRAALGYELKYTSVPRKPFTLEASLSKGCPFFRALGELEKQRSNPLNTQWMWDNCTLRQRDTVGRLKAERFDSVSYLTCPYNIIYTGATTKPDHKLFKPPKLLNGRWNNTVPLLMHAGLYLHHLFEWCVVVHGYVLKLH